MLTPTIWPTDPWGMRGDSSSDDTQASTSKTTTAVRIMSTVRRFSYNSPRKRERGPLESVRVLILVPQVGPSSCRTPSDCRPRCAESCPFGGRELRGYYDVQSASSHPCHGGVRHLLSICTPLPIFSSNHCIPTGERHVLYPS